MTYCELCKVQRATVFVRRTRLCAACSRRVKRGLPLGREYVEAAIVAQTIPKRVKP